MFKIIRLAIAVSGVALSAQAADTPAGGKDLTLSDPGAGLFERYVPIGDPVVHEGRAVEGQPFVVQAMTYADYGVLSEEVTGVRRGLMPRLSLKAGTAFYRSGTIDGGPEWCTLPAYEEPICLYTENGVWKAFRTGGAPLGGYVYWQLAAAPVVAAAAYPGQVVVRVQFVRDPKSGLRLRQERDTSGPDGRTFHYASETSLARLGEKDVTLWCGNGKGVRLHMEAGGVLTVAALSAGGGR